MNPVLALVVVFIVGGAVVGEFGRTLWAVGLCGVAWHWARKRACAIQLRLDDETRLLNARLLRLIKIAEDAGPDPMAGVEAADDLARTRERLVTLHWQRWALPVFGLVAVVAVLAML